MGRIRDHYVHDRVLRTWYRLEKSRTHLYNREPKAINVKSLLGTLQVAQKYFNGSFL